MHIAIISLFPEMFQPLTRFGVVGRAFQQQNVKLSLINPRDFTTDRHRTVDDRPYGGGAGMVMLAEPIYQAILHAKAMVADKTKVYYLCPQGEPFNQQRASQLSQSQSMILLCGRYEGLDQRVIDHHVDGLISIGDYILSGGEMAALSIIDSVVRLMPGVLGHEDSARYESFQDNLLEHPHYTRPESWQGHTVPKVLCSGNHHDISQWQKTQSLKQTERYRPDLLTETDKSSR